MIRIVSVTPTDSGWAVKADGFEPTVFLSGAKAEAAARKLADRMAEGGGDVEIRIYLRDGTLAGRFLRSPELALAG